MNFKPKTGTKVESLQFLRFLAAFTVIICHSGFYASERLVPDFNYWRSGASGVDLFFVISGWVMVLSSRNLLEKINGWREFVVNRAIRIVPLYWMMTTLKIVIMACLPGAVLHASLSAGTVLSSYFFIPHYNVDGEIKPILGVGWSLNSEVFFYFFMALSIFLRLYSALFIGIFFTFFVFINILYPNSLGPFEFYGFSWNYEFLFGMVIARYYNIQKPQKIFGLFALTLGFIFLYFTPYQGTTLPSVIVSGIPAAFMVWGALHLEQYFQRMGKNIFIYLGNASYSLYLVHPIVAPLIPMIMRKTHMIYPVISTILSVLIALSAGCIVHEAIEIPVTRILKIKSRHFSILRASN